MESNISLNHKWKRKRKKSFKTVARVKKIRGQTIASSGAIKLKTDSREASEAISCCGCPNSIFKLIFYILYVIRSIVFNCNVRSSIFLQINKKCTHLLHTGWHIEDWAALLKKRRIDWGCAWRPVSCNLHIVCRCTYVDAQYVDVRVQVYLGKMSLEFTRKISCVKHGVGKRDSYHMFQEVVRKLVCLNKLVDVVDVKCEYAGEH